jgi:hypothetical protein
MQSHLPRKQKIEKSSKVVEAETKQHLVEILNCSFEHNALEANNEGLAMLL